MLRVAADESAAEDVSATRPACANETAVEAHDDRKTAGETAEAEDNETVEACEDDADAESPPPSPGGTAPPRPRWGRFPPRRGGEAGFVELRMD